MSELVALCNGSDPVLTIEDRYGIPRDVVDIDHGVMTSPAGVVAYVSLEPAREDDEED